MALASTCKAVSGSVEERFCICLTKLGKLQEFAKKIYLHSTLLVCASCSAGSASDALSACDNEPNFKASKKQGQHYVKQWTSHHRHGFVWRCSTTPVSACKAVSRPVEKGFCICLTKLGKQTSNVCKRNGCIFWPAPLAQLALAPMPSLPVTTIPASKRTNNKANTTQVKGVITIGKVLVRYDSGFDQ